MTGLDAFTAAYMAACKDRPSDWNEIGYWYARQLWQAAIKAEREACALACDKLAAEYRAVYKGRAAIPIAQLGLRYNPHTDGLSDGAGECAAAIRARGEG